MNDPTRLLDESPDDLGAALLRAGRDVDASASRARRAALVGAAVATTAIVAAATPAATKPLWLLASTKWAVIGAVALASVASGVAVTRAFDVRPGPLGVKGAPPALRAPAVEALPVEVAAAVVDPPVVAAPTAEAAPAPVTPRALAPIAARAEAPEAAAPGVAAADPTSSLAEEVALLRQARAAVAGGDAGGALSLLDRHARLPARRLAVEAEVLRVEALAASGDAAAAARSAADLLRAAPDSPYASRLRAVAGEN